jgi:thiamine biosynthesis lipoprotein
VSKFEVNIKPQPSNVEHPDDWASVQNVHRVAHWAMNATFETIIQHEDSVYARQASQAAFDLLDRLEGDLSRYIETSDVSRINNLAAGAPLQVSLDTFACLKISKQMYAETGGTFDVTTGLLMDCWRDERKNPRTPSNEELAFARTHTGLNLLRLDESRYTVELAVSPIRVDLGAVGKGFGVDRIGQSLREWGLDRALINGGYSSALALGAPVGLTGWPVTFSDPADRQRVLARLSLANAGISGSGIEKGSHIIDPRSGQPVHNRITAWSVAETGAAADALSTAFMVMTADEVREYCRLYESTRALLVQPETAASDRVVPLGTWPQAELLY